MHINTIYDEVKYVFNFVFDCLSWRSRNAMLWKAINGIPYINIPLSFCILLLYSCIFKNGNMLPHKLVISYNKKKVDFESVALVWVVSTISGFLKNYLLFCLTQRSTWLGCDQHSDVTRLPNICLCALGGKSQPSLAPNALYFTLLVVQNCI